jgi:hydrogenase nickel incorporation protein HypA/HybF
MHELAIAQSIFEVVNQQAMVHRAARVQAINLKIGEAHGIVLDSLTFSFAMLTETEPVLAGALLKVETVPYCARCQQCGKEFVIQQFVCQCPVCQSWSSEIVSGTEFQICSMEFEPAPTM